MVNKQGKEYMSSTIEKLASLNLTEDAVATLTYKDGTDVLHYNESEIDTALTETDVVEQLADLISTPGLKARGAWNSTLILDSIRENGNLEDYERGSHNFSDYLASVINENFQELDLIDTATEKYDHKRGFTTLTATVKVSVQNLISSHPHLGAWDVEIQTENGTLKLG